MFRPVYFLGLQILLSASSAVGLGLVHGHEGGGVHEEPLLITLLVCEWLLLCIHGAATALGRSSVLFDSWGCGLQVIFRGLVVVSLLAIPPSQAHLTIVAHHVLRVFCAGNTAVALFVLVIGVALGTVTFSTGFAMLSTLRTAVAVGWVSTLCAPVCVWTLALTRRAVPGDAWPGVNTAALWGLGVGEVVLGGCNLGLILHLHHCRRLLASGGVRAAAGLARGRHSMPHLRLLTLVILAHVGHKVSWAWVVHKTVAAVRGLADLGQPLLFWTSFSVVALYCAGLAVVVLPVACVKAVQSRESLRRWIEVVSGFRASMDLTVPRASLTPTCLLLLPAAVHWLIMGVPTGIVLLVSPGGECGADHRHRQYLVALFVAGACYAVLFAAGRMLEQTARPGALFSKAGCVLAAFLAVAMVSVQGTALYAAMTAPMCSHIILWTLTVHASVHFATWVAAVVVFMTWFAHVRLPPVDTLSWRDLGFLELYFSQPCVVSYVYHTGKVAAWPCFWGPVTITVSLVASVVQYRLGDRRQAAYLILAAVVALYSAGSSVALVIRARFCQSSSKWSMGHMGVCVVLQFVVLSVVLAVWQCEGGGPDCRHLHRMWVVLVASVAVLVAQVVLGSLYLTLARGGRSFLAVLMASSQEATLITKRIEALQCAAIDLLLADSSAEIGAVK